MSFNEKRYVPDLFENTTDGKITIVRRSDCGEPEYTVRYRVDWNRTDAEALADTLEKLTATLRRLGTLHDLLLEERNRQSLLTAEELAVWETYVKPFEPCPVDLDEVKELYQRAWAGDELTDDENNVLEQHSDWEQQQSLTRLPQLRKSPRDVLLRARRYEALSRLNAPDAVLNAEARCLAEELVLYRHYEADPDNMVDRILSKKTEE